MVKFAPAAHERQIQMGHVVWNSVLTGSSGGRTHIFSLTEADPRPSNLCPISGRDQ